MRNSYFCSLIHDLYSGTQYGGAQGNHVGVFARCGGARTDSRTPGVGIQGVMALAGGALLFPKGYFLLHGAFNFYFHLLMP